ncbi:conserved oligomeric Golgi complex subunit 4 isoform X2 [Zootermopsis nevadensis]|uniref:conserved oligomeric Golgi complex subunit 4 isoform X2 n=1 Tax=Zootermopsis nevadensis TaxID=136037 RepID=UPI000B8EB6FF|nr:conserved oligomeric Golgi complex subunit 4 isoform X2 [Zootermopsis nevadensis]
MLQTTDLDVSIQEEINNGLETLLSRQCHLEAKLRGITKVLPNLQIVHSDAQQLAEMITFTSTLAENVSSKVRQLDIARSRVSECQQRVHDLLDLQLCSDGVQTALRNEDFEKAAAHVHRFLSMDQHLLKQTADDVAEDCTSVTNSFSLLHEAATQLGAVVTQKFDEAVHADDLASVERFFKIFPLLGMQDEGLVRFSSYLCSKLKDTALKNLRLALETNTSDKRANVIYADTITLLFEGIARVIEIHQPLIETYYGPGRLLTVASYLQRECDRQSKRILAEFSKCRHLEKIVQQVNEYMRTNNVYSKPTDKLDPKELDLLLGELTIMHSRAELYVRFIRRRVMNDLEIGVPSGDTRTALVSELEAMLNGSELCHRMQELLSSYLLLERYFMEESVKKAVVMDSVEEGSHTSSMVDDVFFIVRKCIRRAGTSSSLDGVCAVINNACALLETDFCEVLRRQLRQGYPSGYLDLTQAYSVLHTSIQQGRLQASDSEQARLMFLTYLNNADASTEYTDTLRRSLMDEVPSVLTTMSENERVKLESCLSGLGSVAASLKAVIDYGMEQLRVIVIKPRVNPWVDTFLSVSHQLSEEDFANYEANEPFVQNLIMNLDGLLGLFRGSLTTSNYDTLVSILTAEVTAHLEKVVIKSTFNRLGGLVFDKEVRALVSYLTSTTSWSIRDKFARLTQMATVLNLERVTEISDYWGSNSGPLTWRLTPADIRQVMTLRTDFRSDDIKRLKL